MYGAIAQHYVAGPAFTTYRFYLPSVTAAPVTPAIDPAWGLTAGHASRELKTVPALAGGGAGTVSIAEISASVIDVMTGQFVSASDVFPVGPIVGEFRMVVAMRESGTGLADMYQQARIHIFNSAGTIKRGTLYAGQVTNSVSAGVGDPNQELAFSTQETRLLGNPAPIALTPGTTFQSGDRLVLEHGCRACNLSSTSRTVFSTYRDDNLSPGDLPFTAGLNDNRLPWIEFTLAA